MTETWARGFVVCFSQFLRHHQWSPSRQIVWDNHHMIWPRRARSRPSLGAGNFEANNLGGHRVVSKYFSKLPFHSASVGHEKTPHQNWLNAHDLQGAIVDARIDLDYPCNSITQLQRDLMPPNWDTLVCNSFLLIFKTHSLIYQVSRTDHTSRQ